MTKFFFTCIINLVALGVNKMKMKWSLNELKRYLDEPFVFSDNVDLKESLVKREEEILDVSPIHLDGILTVNDDELILHMNVSLKLTLPSARSLEPVLFPMDFVIDEVYIPKSDSYEKPVDEESVVIYLEHDWLDLSESIEDSILLNLPLQVFTEEEEKGQDMPAGNNWTVISEEDYYSKEKESKETVDPRFAGLKDFFKNDESSNQEED